MSETNSRLNHPAKAVVCCRWTMTRIIGAPTEADQIMVYAFDDTFILVIPKAGRAYVARNRHDREHFQRLLEEQTQR